MTRDQATLSLLKLVAPMLQNYAQSTGCDFDDLYQNASITILKILDTGKLQVRDLERYVITSVKHMVLMELRSRKIRQALSLDAPLNDESDAITLADLLPDPHSQDPATVYLAKEHLEELRVFTQQPMHHQRSRAIREWQETVAASLEMEETAI
jgi:DNA-directed RNA polymerase specialized sigma subunit